MPEGDTIHRTATTLRTVLLGKTVTSFELGGRAGPTPANAPQTGERIGPVAARGKHLLIGFSGGRTLHTHLQMSGSWHTYRSGDRWQRPRRHMVAAIATHETEAICFNTPVVELLDERSLMRHPRLGALGPDLCDPDPDLDEITRRVSRHDPATPIGVILLDQTVAAGIGNVYKSEALWAECIEPFAQISSVDPATLRNIYRTAGAQLRANLNHERSRHTVPQGLAVYDRAGQPCRRCGTPIRTRRQGTTARSTWWCPACQT